MGPVYESAEFVPFVHPAELYAIAQRERDAPGEFDVVRYQKALAIWQLQNESLMPRTVGIIG